MKNYEKNNYQMCVRCIMDTTDPDIQFDENGVCNHCRKYDEMAKKYLFLGEDRQQKLDKLINEIKEKGKNKKYDCIIGVSGGVDSTFVAYKVKELGLRPLAVHLDNGWNSELAVENIEKTIKKLGIDLYTYTVDWEEFRDLQISFLKASVPDAEIPTDHALMAFLYRVAVERGVQYIIIGTNTVTEAIMPAKWAYGHRDWKYIKNVYKKFGKIKLKGFLHYSLLDLLQYIFVKKIKLVRILNYITYNKKEAIKILENEVGWKYYGGKHYESIYTRFVQAYILPRKFNIDKRKAHLSTLICSGQITRKEALEETQHAPYPTEEMRGEDRNYVIKKLGLSKEEFERIMSLPIKSYNDYPSNYWFFWAIQNFKIGRILRKLKIFKDY